MLADDGTTALLLAFAKEMEVWQLMQDELPEHTQFFKVPLLKTSGRMLHFTERFPVFNEEIEYRKLTFLGKKSINRAAIEGYILGDLCPLIKAKSEDLNPMEISKLTPSPCSAMCNK